MQCAAINVLAAAIAQGFVQEELRQRMIHAGINYLADDGLRHDSTVEKLAALKPIF